MYPRPAFFNDRGSEALLNCGLCREPGIVRTSATQVTPCACRRPMNSPSVRVAWPRVSTRVEDSRPARLFPPRPAGLVLTAEGLIFGICLRDTRYHFDSPAEIKLFVPPWARILHIVPNSSGPPEITSRDRRLCPVTSGCARFGGPSD